MLIPLVLLAIFSLLAGYVGIPAAITGSHEPIADFLRSGTSAAEAEHGSVALEWALMLASVAAAVLGLALAYVFYVKRPELPARVSSSASALYSILTNKYYVDEIYSAIFVLPIVVASRQFLWQLIDVAIIDGIVNGIGKTVRSMADGLRHMQTGYVRTYAGWILFGGIVVVAWFLR
jgi:NADH-quinone oxidoreductase subunit L